MKQITNYIIEKANFIVKKHVKTPTDKFPEIHSFKDIVPGCFYVEHTIDNEEYLCKAKLEQNDSTCIDIEYYISFKNDWPAVRIEETYSDNTGSTYRSLDEDEQEVVNIFEDWIVLHQSKYNNCICKEKGIIGRIKNDKFIYKPE